MIRLIHCADLHLDSRLNTYLEPEKARARRNELLDTWVRMVEFAEQYEICGILIAGDLFDRAQISRTARNAVLETVENHPKIHFFYIRGNHDPEGLGSEKTLPGNLHLFDDHWTAYRMGRVVITGAECENRDMGSLCRELSLDPKDFNIVMLHGQASDQRNDPGQMISLRSMKGQGIDYLALGHIHAYQKEALDARGIWCYPGCLEGRGYDECGDHGFCVLGIDEDHGTMEHAFVSFARRRLYEVKVDVTDCRTDEDVVRAAEAALEENHVTHMDMVKLQWCGEKDVESEWDGEYVLARFREQYFHVRGDDRTVLKVDPERYLRDASLKGEFVRTILRQTDLSEEERNMAIRYGLQAIAGEEIQ